MTDQQRGIIRRMVRTGVTQFRLIGQQADLSSEAVRLFILSDYRERLVREHHQEQLDRLYSPDSSADC